MNHRDGLETAIAISSRLHGFQSLKNSGVERGNITYPVSQHLLFCSTFYFTEIWQSVKGFTISKSYKTTRTENLVFRKSENHDINQSRSLTSQIIMNRNICSKGKAGFSTDIQYVTPFHTSVNR